MSTSFTFTAQTRAKVGKGASRAERRNGLVPASVYGDSKEPVSVLLNPKEINQQLYNPTLYSNIYKVSINNKEEEVLVRKLQFHPVKDHVIHVDMLRVGKNTVTRVNVPIKFINQSKSEGLKFGGLLNIVTHTLELAGNPKNIPSSIEIDLANTRVGSVIKIEEVKLPEGIKTYYPKGFALVSITATKEEAKAEQK